MLKGVGLAFLTYGLFASADATIKGFGGVLPVFEIVFFVTLFSFAVIFAARPRHERWRDIFRMNHPKRVFLRSATGTVAVIAGVYAFTTVPLAEAYALIFLTPAFVTLLSIPILGERVGWRRLSAVAAGFAGILLVVRPGFRELDLGHLAAAIVAVASAISIIVLRMIGHTERRVSLLGVVMVTALVVSGLLMLPVFRWPGPETLALLALAGLFAGAGQVTMMAALRNAPANRVSPAQYSQILWAVLLGAYFYDEFPDLLALGGMVLIGFSGLFTLLREDRVSGWPRRSHLLRNRP